MAKWVSAAEAEAELTDATVLSPSEIISRTTFRPSQVTVDDDATDYREADASNLAATIVDQITRL
jgi:hypothetical protein